MSFFQPRLDEIRHLRQLGLDTLSIDIQSIYCQHTGRPIGVLDESELDFILTEEDIDLDDESLLDAIVVRVIASMRPSPALNKPDRLTIRNLAAHAQLTPWPIF
jgi:hypothetical protein